MALLHDVGRFVQYEDGTPSAGRRAPLAEKLMDRLASIYGREKARILRAIENTGTGRIRDEKGWDRHSLPGGIKCP